MLSMVLLRWEAKYESMENELRDRIVLKIVEVLLERGMDHLQSTTNFGYFLRSNPLLLANAIVEGKALTGDEMVRITGQASS